MLAHPILPGLLLAFALAIRPPVADGAETAPASVVQLALWPGQLRAHPGEEIPRRAAPNPRPPDGLPLPPPTPLSPDRGGSIRAVTPHAGRTPIALTFDLCETAGEIAGYDGAIVDLLRDQQVPATFFAGGKWMRSHPERTMQLMADPLFEVGNHGWAHRNLRLATPALLASEIEWPQAQYRALRATLRERALAAGLAERDLESIPQAPAVFRFPFGVCTPDALAQVAAHGLAPVQWSIVSGDPAPRQTAAAIVRIVRQQAKPGAIVVFHANGRGRGTRAALEQLVPALRAQGLEFVTISGLLRQAEQVTATPDCYEIRPGDNARYDVRRR